MEEVITTKKVPLLGGWSDKSPESADIKVAAQYAVKMFNTQSKGKKMFKLVSIDAAQAQVTNVIHFKIEAVLGKTKCFKDENHDLESCSLERKRTKCYFEVTLNPHESEHELKEQNCTRIDKKV